MNKNEMKNRISLALKDPILQQGFEIICKENSTLDKSLITSTKNNIERQRIIDELKEENAELKEEMKAKQVVLNDFKSRVETVTDRFNKKSSQLTEAKEIIKKFLDAKNIEDTCVAESEAEHFLQELSISFTSRSF